MMEALPRSRRKTDREFFSYISFNIVGMLGISCYIIADTYFIARCAGADGVTVLNLCLPVYNLIFAVGAMIGIGSAILFALSGERGEGAASYFFAALFWTLFFGLFVAIVFGMQTADILRIMGGDEAIVALGIPYLRIVLWFAPLFMGNYVFTSFIRNDGSPGLAMAATVISSLFNIVFDYIFMFPMGMGLMGAALATALSPAVSMLLCCLHFFRPHNRIHRADHIFSYILRLPQVIRFGISFFVGEIAAGVTTMVFNILILNLTGNIGVAAYGVTANLAIVGTSLFNGIAQGSQPLVSRYYAEGEKETVKRIFSRGIGTSLVTASLLYAFVWLFTSELVALFNGENSEILAVMAMEGIRLYFIGFFFSGVNIFLTASLGASNRPIPSACIALSRGIVMIVICAVVLAKTAGMRGIWLTYPVTEALTLILGTALLFLSRNKKETD